MNGNTKPMNRQPFYLHMHYQSNKKIAKYDLKWQFPMVLKTTHLNKGPFLRIENSSLTPSSYPPPVLAALEHNKISNSMLNYDKSKLLHVFPHLI